MSEKEKKNLFPLFICLHILFSQVSIYFPIIKHFYLNVMINHNNNESQSCIVFGDISSWKHHLADRNLMKFNKCEILQLGRGHFTHQQGVGSTVLKEAQKKRTRKGPEKGPGGCQAEHETEVSKLFAVSCQLGEVLSAG